MLAEDQFASITALIAEPSRAKMLWNLLDGRALTAAELATAANVSPQSASNHLAKLTKADLLKVEHQGRHRYYRFARPEVAYVIESIANLMSPATQAPQVSKPVTQGMKYAWTCYDHLAGQIAIELMQAFIQAEFVVETNQQSLTVTEKGWQWLASLGIWPENLKKNSRPLLRTCLDWTERKPHLAGTLGAELFKKFVELDWIRRTANSRAIILTPLGKMKLYEQLGMT
jgi:DNA-binding transcriptional ArsR family regulator